MRYPDDFAPDTQQEWDVVKADLLDGQGWACEYCEKSLKWKTATFDHVIPRCQGGTDHVVNLVMACGRCNSSKGGRNRWEWREPEDYAQFLASQT